MVPADKARDVRVEGGLTGEDPPVFDCTTSSSKEPHQSLSLKAQIKRLFTPTERRRSEPLRAGESETRPKEKQHSNFEK